MQSRVENGRLTIRYSDGGSTAVSLVNPLNFDDWLVAGVQQESECAYFSDCNHGIVVRIPLERQRTLSSLDVRAVSDEVIVGLRGVSLAR
jgi:hypothetical protein